MKIVNIYFDPSSLVKNYRADLNSRLNCNDETSFILNPNPDGAIFKTPFNQDVYPDIKPTKSTKQNKNIVVMTNLPVLS